MVHGNAFAAAGTITRGAGVLAEATEAARG